MSPTPQERRQSPGLRRLPAILGHGADGGPLQARPALLPQPGLRPSRGGGVHGEHEQEHIHLTVVAGVGGGARRVSAGWGAACVPPQLDQPPPLPPAHHRLRLCHCQAPHPRQVPTHNIRNIFATYSHTLPGSPPGCPRCACPRPPPTTTLCLPRCRAGAR